MHAAGHFLNPEFFYDNPSMEFDGEIVRGLYECIHKLVSNLEVEKKIMLELHTYKTAGDMFASNIAVSMRKTVSPSQNLQRCSITPSSFHGSKFFTANV